MAESDDPFVSCPYEAIHRVPKSRLQRHIIKCAKNYPTYQICPYNATHRFPPETIKNHVRDCPAKLVVFENYVNIPKTTGDITKPKPIIERQYLKPSDPEYEDWDSL